MYKRLKREALLKPTSTARKIIQLNQHVNSYKPIARHAANIKVGLRWGWFTKIKTNDGNLTKADYEQNDNYKFSFYAVRGKEESRGKKITG